MYNMYMDMDMYMHMHMYMYMYMYMYVHVHGHGHVLVYNAVASKDDQEAGALLRVDEPISHARARL